MLAVTVVIALQRSAHGINGCDAVTPRQPSAATRRLPAVMAVAAAVKTLSSVVGLCLSITSTSRPRGVVWSAWFFIWRSSCARPRVVVAGVTVAQEVSMAASKPC